MSREIREMMLVHQREMTERVHRIYARLPVCRFCGKKIDRVQPRKMRDEIRKRFWRGSFCRCKPDRRTSKRKSRYNYTVHNEARR
jgi:hypothetical protein